MFNGTLHVENVHRGNDQGTYTCVARNRHNESSERSVVVKVLGKFMLQRNFLYNLFHLILLKN